MDHRSRGPLITVVVAAAAMALPLVASGHAVLEQIEKDLAASKAEFERVEPIRTSVQR